MKLTLARKLFIYTSLCLCVVLVSTFMVLEHYQAQQWESYLRLQNLSFARLATPELMKMFRGVFGGQDSLGHRNVSDYLSFNPDLIQFSLLSPGGRLLYRSEVLPGHEGEGVPSEVGNDPSSSRWRIDEPLARDFQSPTTRGRVLEILAPAFGPTGEQVLVARYLVSYRSVDERLKEVRSRFLLIGISSAACALILVALVARKITRPIRALTLGARSIARGELDNRLTVSGDDELAVLSLAFNDMTQSLASSQKELLTKNEALVSAYEDLRQVQKQLVQSERLAVIGQLAAGVSHEIDNPVGIILGYAELLLEELDSADPHCEDVQAIIDECRRCKKITGSLLGLARSAAMRTGPVDLKGLIGNTLETLKPQKLFREIELVFSDEGDDLEILGDQDQLRQVLVNLLLNSAQAMKGRGRVQIALQGRADVAVVKLQDSGPGISVHPPERIFEPFFTTKPSGEGTGLGLAVCRKLVEELGGRLELELHDGAGACFKIEFPLVHTDMDKEG